MLLQELIEKLQEELAYKWNVIVWVYNEEEAEFYWIDFIDNDITDRVDIVILRNNIF